MTVRLGDVGGRLHLRPIPRTEKVLTCKEIIIPYIVTGFGGNPRLADVGGVPYLMPLVQREKVSGLCVQSHRMFFKYDVVAMSEIPGWWGRIHEY